MSDLAKHRVTVTSVTEPDLCSDDPARKLTRQVFGAIAEYDKAMIVLKLRAARTRVKQAAGRCEGRKPYGFRKGEEEVIQKMYELRRGRFSVNKIAEHLNMWGIPSRAGGLWYAASVSRAMKRRHPRDLPDPPPEPVKPTDSKEYERRRRSFMRYRRIDAAKQRVEAAAAKLRQEAEENDRRKNHPPA